MVGENVVLLVPRRKRRLRDLLQVSWKLPGVFLRWVVLAAQGIRQCVGERFNVIAISFDCDSPWGNGVIGGGRARGVKGLLDLDVAGSSRWTCMWRRVGAVLGRLSRVLPLRGASSNQSSQLGSGYQ